MTVQEAIDRLNQMPDKTRELTNADGTPIEHICEWMHPRTGKFIDPKRVVAVFTRNPYPDL